MSEYTVECPVDGCGSEINIYMLMCRHHWFQVPQILRGEIQDAWRSRLRARRGVDEKLKRATANRHRAAKDAAIEHVNRMSNV